MEVVRGRENPWGAALHSAAGTLVPLPQPGSSGPQGSKPPEPGYLARAPCLKGIGEGGVCRESQLRPMQLLPAAPCCPKVLELASA